MKSNLDLHVELEREGDSELFEDLQRYLTKHPRLTRFFFSTAGIIFAMGVVLFIGMALGALGIYMVDPESGREVYQLALAEIAGGREVAIPLGLQTFGLPPLLVFGISATQDLVTTTWVYPVFYFTRKQNMGRRNFVGYIFNRMAKKAEKNKRFVERYGAIGLFLFMLVPFAVNGPLIGAIIGKLVGIRTRYILPTVFLATVVATAAWTALWHYSGPQVREFTEEFGGERYITLAMMLVVGVFLALSILGFLGDLRRFRAIKQHEEELRRRAQVTQTLYVSETESSDAGGQAPKQEP